MFTRIGKFIRKNLRNFNLSRSVSSQAAVIFFFLSLFCTLAIAKKLAQQKLVEERNQIANLTNDYAHDIQRNLTRTLSVTYALSALVHEYDGLIPNFTTVAQELLPLYPGAYALALLPKEIDQGIVVSHGKEASLNSLKLECFAQNTEILPLPKEKESILTEYFPDINDFAASIGCLPVFLTQKQNDDSFWGFASVIIQYSQLLEDIHLEELEKRGLAYQLWYENSDTQEKQLISSSAKTIINNPVKQVIELPHGSWILNVAPINGWNKPPRFFITSVLGLFFSLMLATLIKLFLDSQVHADELEKIAYFDPLTSLPNRRLLFYRLEQMISASQRNKKQVVICCLDLDDFKTINENLGTKIGDYILVRIAKRLQKFLRVEDVIARIGGDEFAIILQNISHIEEAEMVLERIMEAVTTPITIESEIIAVSTSIGVTIYPQDNSNIENLLRHAYQGMYHVKKTQKGSYVLFNNLEQTITQSLPFQT